MKRRCDNCRWAIMQDYGYSNYTVENTNMICAQRAHPEREFDRFYGEDKRLLHAEKCEHYGEGSPVELDVDGENEDEFRRGIFSSQAEREAWELHVTFGLLEDQR